MGEAFSIVVTVIILGFLWFYIARPILEDYGVIAPRDVNDYEDAAPVVMSRSADEPAPSIASSLETRPVQTPDQAIDPAARRAKLLDTYRPLRKLGMCRDDARALLNPWGIPLDNNLWTEAAPQTPYVTPVAGRPTSARFETDPELRYEAPA